jgi:hypothetical protein
MFRPLLPRADRQPAGPAAEQPIAETIDLARLTPELQQAVSRAREAALQHARSELDQLHIEIMSEVEGSFLDWYFGYWTQQRLGFSYLVNQGKSWITGGNADQELQDEIAREFDLRVMPAPLLDERLHRITRQTIATFAESLQAHIHGIALRYNIPPSRWDAHLQNIVTTVGLTDGSGSIPLTLKALATGVVWSGTGAALAIAPRLAAQFSAGPAFAGGTSGALVRPLTRQASGLVLRQAATRGAAATMGSFGPVAEAIALGGLVAWEAWDHHHTVAENRPLLRDNIDQFLRSYETDLLEQPGMIGASLDDLTTKILAGLVAQ